MRNARDKRRFGTNLHALAAIWVPLVVVLDFHFIAVAEYPLFTNPVTIFMGGSVYGANAGVVYR